MKTHCTIKFPLMCALTLSLSLQTDSCCKVLLYSHLRLGSIAYDLYAFVSLAASRQFKLGIITQKLLINKTQHKLFSRKWFLYISQSTFSPVSRWIPRCSIRSDAWSNACIQALFHASERREQSPIVICTSRSRHISRLTVTSHSHLSLDEFWYSPTGKLTSSDPEMGDDLARRHLKN